MARTKEIFSFQPDAAGICDFETIVEMCKRAAHPVERSESYVLFGCVS
jgi:hypothetical protein